MLELEIFKAVPLVPSKVRVSMIPVPATSSFAPGVVEEIPTFPLLEMKSLEVSRALPPGLWRRLNVPLLKISCVTAGAAPVGALSAKLPEIEAVGVPLATFINANFAELVAVLPIKTSATVAH